MESIKPYKNRKVDITKPVEVYRCLNRKGKVYSVRQDGVVVGHTEKITLRNVEFIVNKKGQERCRKTGSRNVHAYMKGYLKKDQTQHQVQYEYVRYNPYTSPGFMLHDERGKEMGVIRYAQHVSIKKDGMVWVLNVATKGKQTKIEKEVEIRSIADMIMAGDEEYKGIKLPTPILPTQHTYARRRKYAMAHAREIYRRTTI